MRTTFADRILLIGPALEHYAQQKMLLRKLGRRVDDMDLLIGVTALAQGLTLVTRNTRLFRGLTAAELGRSAHCSTVADE